MVVHHDVSYLDKDSAFDPYRSMDIYVGNGPSITRALVVYIHGGLWTDRDKSEYVVLATALSATGNTVAIINYRLSKKDNDVRHPQHTIDIATALAFLSRKVNGTTYQYDHSRVICIGHSCGAHIIGLIAANRHNGAFDVATLIGAVGIQGLYDTRRFAQAAPQWSDMLALPLGEQQAQWENPGDYKQKSGLHWQIIHSRDDVWVGVEQSERFYAHLIQGGAAHSVHEYGSYGGHFEAVQNPTVMNLVREYIERIDATRSSGRELR